MVSITAKKPVSGRKWPGFGSFSDVVGSDRKLSGSTERVRVWADVVGSF